MRGNRRTARDSSSFNSVVMEQILHMLGSIHPISGEGLEAFRRLLKVKELPKKNYLLRAGHVCQYIYFIESGLLRCFYLKEDMEVCSWFMMEGDIIISVESFFQQKSSYEYIQAIEDCRLYYLHYSELQYMYRHYPEFNFIGRVLTEKYYCLSEQRLYSLRMQRAQERYQYLLEHHNDWVLRVPSKYLASYLGLSEAHFSVIKAKH